MNLLRRRGLFEKKTRKFSQKIEILQNWFLGVLKPADGESGSEKFLQCLIEGPDEKTLHTQFQGQRSKLQYS